MNEKFIKILFSLIFCSLSLSSQITKNELNKAKIYEAGFWQDYQNILDESIIIGNYSGRYGSYFHNAVDYEKVVQDKSLASSFQAQTSKLKQINQSDINKLTTNQKLAFWINAYNFFTLLDIKNHYPIDSMKDLGWKNKRFEVAGKKYSLDNIEHGIIRSTKIPEIHFAVNCASVSCPTLYPKVFDHKTIRADLALLTQTAFKNPIHLSLKDKLFSAKKKIEVSKLLRWYKKDFGNNDLEVLRFIHKYAPKEYQKYDDYSAGLEYNWDLNSKLKIKNYLKKIQ